ncbi:MAG: hypothetical protein GF320_02970 [Armatimonadia bacterium]|nr:hypothetical protein [Armatimonadia bacterium]
MQQPSPTQQPAGPVTQNLQSSWGTVLAINIGIGMTLGVGVGLLVMWGISRLGGRPMGVAGWIGGIVLLAAINVVLAVVQTSNAKGPALHAAAQLDWAFYQCPICMGGPMRWDFRFGRPIDPVSCSACGARWETKLDIGKDPLKSIKLTNQGQAATDEIRQSLPRDESPVSWLQWIQWRRGQ